MNIGERRLRGRRVIGAAALFLGLACGASALLAYSQGRREGAIEAEALKRSLAEAQAALTEARSLPNAPAEESLAAAAIARWPYVIGTNSGDWIVQELLGGESVMTKVEAQSSPRDLLKNSGCGIVLTPKAMGAQILIHDSRLSVDGQSFTYGEAAGLVDAKMKTQFSLNFPLVSASGPGD